MSGDHVTHDAIRGILAEVTSLRNCATLPADADLRRAGMTSFELTSLLLQVEETFDVSLSDDAITHADTASIAAIAATIDRARARPATP